MKQSIWEDNIRMDCTEIKWEDLDWTHVAQERENNIKMHLRETGCDGVNCIQLTQDMIQWKAFLSMEMNLLVPRKQGIS
jgi:hypothetical protein